jgi:hypothetical protein
MVTQVVLVMAQVGVLMRVEMVMAHPDLHVEAHRTDMISGPWEVVRVVQVR